MTQRIRDKEASRIESKRRYKELIESKAKNAPDCECGCGQKTLWSIRTKSYGKYLFNHQIPDLSGNWTPRIEEIVRGTILGDGHLDTRKSRKGIETGSSRLSIRHSTKRQLKYCQWKRQELAPITTCKLRIRTTPDSYGKEIAEFSTLSLEKLYAIRQETYFCDIKQVTPEYLATLTDFSVAVWWMDDGGNCSLSTHSFTHDENELIAQWHNDRYGTRLRVSIDKRINLPYIYCDTQSLRALAPHIFPYFQRSLWYKFKKILPELLQHESAKSLQLEPLQPMT